MNKSEKIFKLIETFYQQVKLASSKEEEIFNLLKQVKKEVENEELPEDQFKALWLSVGTKASNLSEKEFNNLMDIIGETGNEKSILSYSEVLYEAIDGAKDEGLISDSQAQNSLFFLDKEMKKALEPGPSLINKNEESSPKESPPTALSYFNTLNAFNAFMNSNSNDFNPDLKNKVNTTLNSFGNALEQYDNNDKEMSIQEAQRWVDPILIPIASLMAMSGEKHWAKNNKLWMNIAANSGGQIPKGFQYGTWLEARRIPYHQATPKDVADLAKLGIKIIAGEYILPIEYIKKYPTPNQKAQMNAAKLIKDTAKGVQLLGDKFNPFKK